MTDEFLYLDVGSGDHKRDSGVLQPSPGREVPGEQCQRQGARQQANSLRLLLLRSGTPSTPHFTVLYLSSDKDDFC
ncbi:hypothetical protein BAE44_0016355 [Dichanthelium oligosanthes]|uniref:Uncharacterized protein n=1 Tax=Dichanthelium oligosanthes TaxID=888268 RepID=A0A1E5VC81_9POAL|nr:hypothetical protein BAE44_0016355 [Dichanthelium oligosanthes]